MYNFKNQYRCDIIRGKSQSTLEDMLPAYAKVINDICPCSKKTFDQEFNARLINFLPSTDREKKTLDNHRTEIAGKLFGMYVSNEDGNVYCSERTKKFLEDGDIPAFFKDICFKMQFPNVMQKIQTVTERLQNNIKLRPYCFLIKTLQLAEQQKLILDKKTIGFYILNSLDVLQGIATPEEVISQIMTDKQKGIYREIEGDAASSFKYQHINEQLNYLELANLIWVDGKRDVYLNHKEQQCLDLFSKDWNSELLFKIEKSDISSPEAFKDLQFRWNEYYGKLSSEENAFATKLEALAINDNSQTGYRLYGNTVELGDEGENFVFNFEKDRVGKFNPRLTNKVILFGKQKGLGYDVQSVMAEKHPDIEEYPEFAKYIEVKATRRVTPPNINDAEWFDTVNITRNEYTAALDKKDSYYIYRVFFTRTGVFMYTVNDLFTKKRDGKLDIIPLTYRVELNKESIDQVYDIKNQESLENV